MNTKNIDSLASIVTSVNREAGDIIITKETFGFETEIIKKSDMGHEHSYADSDTANNSAPRTAFPTSVRSTLYSWTPVAAGTATTAPTRTASVRLWYFFPTH